jgi:hypothetical protein
VFQRVSLLLLIPMIGDRKGTLKDMRLNGSINGFVQTCYET